MKVGISALAIIVLVFSGMLSQLLVSALLLVKVPAGICNIVAGIFYIGIAAGFMEEMVFRGLILNCIKKAWNEKAAIIIPSVLFGFVHVLGQGYLSGKLKNIIWNLMIY